MTWFAMAPYRGMQRPAVGRVSAQCGPYESRFCVARGRCEPAGPAEAEVGRESSTFCVTGSGHPRTNERDVLTHHDDAQPTPVMLTAVAAGHRSGAAIFKPSALAT